MWFGQYDLHLQTEINFFISQTNCYKYKIQKQYTTYTKLNRYGLLQKIIHKMGQVYRPSLYSHNRLSIFFFLLGRVSKFQVEL